MNIEIGQGLVKTGSPRSGDRYYLVVDFCQDDSDQDVGVYCVEVKSRYFLNPDVGGIVVHCFDEPGAIYEYDRDNVGLKHTTDVFTDLKPVGTRWDKYGYCCAVADLSEMVFVSFADIKAGVYRIADAGRRIDDRDLKVVCNHLWPFGPEKELVSSRIRDALDRFGDLDDELSDKSDEIDFGF